MRIAVSAHLYPSGSTYRSAGVARYVKELITRLPAAAPQHEFLFFVPPGVNVPGGRPSRLSTEHPAVRIIWEQLIEPVALVRERADLVHGPVNVTPVLSRPPSVVTVHDLSFLIFPDRLVGRKRRYQAILTRRSTQMAARVIAPSEATKGHLIRAFDLDPERISVVPEGVGPEYRPLPLSQRPVADPYILYVGTIEPRKNLPRLIEAFTVFKARGRPHSLQLVGPAGWLFDDVISAMHKANLGEAIRWHGFVEDLAGWYNHADFFVYPSSFEGFGLPPLEAMACGTPVVLSSAGSLPEVGGDAAMYFDPSDTDSLVGAMEAITDDHKLRSRLRATGLERASRFSWDETARRTAEAYEVAARNG